MTTSESQGTQLTTKGPLLTTMGPWNLQPQPGGPGPLTENQGAHNRRPGGPRAPN